MRATISANGFLKVLPDNSTEQYALRQWWDDQDKGNIKSGIICPHDVGIGEDMPVGVKQIHGTTEAGEIEQ